MTFLQKIEPHLTSHDILIQETVLHALHDFPNVPEEWTYILLKEAFENKEKQTSILIYIENQTLNEKAVNILIENIPKMDQSKVHLALRLVNQIEPNLALKYKKPLIKYIKKDLLSIFELTVDGTEEEVYTEYGKVLNELEESDSFQFDLYIKAKKLAACIVKNGWITENEIDMILEEELKEQWISFNGILHVYMIGLLNLEKYIPLLAPLLVRDDDVLLEEVAVVLIRFQSDQVVNEVAPYLNKAESVIFASSIIENIKSDYAVQVLREAYRNAEELDAQEILIEALCHQLSKEALPEINAHMEKEAASGLVDVEHIAYSYHSILGLDHPDLEWWRKEVLNRENDFSEQVDVFANKSIQMEKVGRNDPCPCGSGKKYKKCCLH
nr:SEC-C metal-binding domain-containing protein [Bacillus sp. Marseille-P3661]